MFYIKNTMKIPMKRNIPKSNTEYYLSNESMPIIKPSPTAPQLFNPDAKPTYRSVPFIEDQITAMYINFSMVLTDTNKKEED